MAKYICTVCGYEYDEAFGDPDSGIAPGTRWEEIPDDWSCPVCGASKDDFEKQKSPEEEKTEVSNKEPERDTGVSSSSFSDDIQLNAAELSVLLSNLARGCEKQYKKEEAEIFTFLAEHFKKAALPAEGADINGLMPLIEEDLQSGFPAANAAAKASGDRGALRALVWSEKVTRIQKSILNRYRKEGDAMLQGTGVYVCGVCGYIHIGDAPPALCPVCKVQSDKFERIGR